MTQTSATAARSDLFTGSFSTYSVRDVEAARKFYSESLGLEVSDEMGGLRIAVPGADALFLYPKEDHEPAVFTVFNLTVKDIADAVDQLTSRGIEFLSYEGEIKTDEKGIHWGNGKGPNLAWFEDPSGNILSVIEE